MRFEWDESKRRANLAKHKLDFADAPEIFKGPMRIALDDRVDYGEDRWIGLGMLYGRVVVVVYAEPGHETIRVLSLRKALNHEQAEYEQALRHGLEGSGPNE